MKIYFRNNINMEIFSIEIQKYMYGVDYKMKIISNILKSTPIEISYKIKYEKKFETSYYGCKLHM